jgi:hypothetical protein
MAIENTKKPRSKQKPTLKFFYLNGELHKVLSVSKPQDFAVCWNFAQWKRVGYVYSDIRRTHQRAFRMMEVSKMIGRHRVNIEWDILKGNIKTPQRRYSLDGKKKPLGYLFSEENVLDLHDYLLTVHYGRPRRDGKITPKQTLPSRTELKAMMKNDIVTYVKTEDGEFVPVWREQDW